MKESRSPFENAGDLLSRHARSLHPSDDELDGLRKLESADKGRFLQESANLDRKYKARVLFKDAAPQHLNRGYHRLPYVRDAIPTPSAEPSSIALLSEVLREKVKPCDCVIPFQFEGVSVMDSMTGADNNDVLNGAIGVIRVNSSDFTVPNFGNTSGTTRVPLLGSITIGFKASIPTAGEHYLVLPHGTLDIRGESHVVGHGNSTTSFDAKVFVDYYYFLYMDADVLEHSGESIHEDATKSENRTQHFAANIALDRRYIVFEAKAGSEVGLLLRLQVHTEANVDGKAIGRVDMFGLLANSKVDYDTVVVKA